MPSPFYRPSSAAGPAGKGVSEDGFEGAQTLFEQLKGVAGDMGCAFIPSNAQEFASAKAAAQSYLAARNGLVTPEQALLGENPQGLPDVQVGTDGASLDANSMDIGKAISDLVSNMGDVLNQAISNPIGFIGQLLGFLFKMFTDIAANIGEALSEAARAAASAMEDAWKKQMEMASAAAQDAGLQPLELYTQSATTQTLSHALKNGAST